MIEITTLSTTGGPLTKRISLAPDGSLHSDGSACTMSHGSARRTPFDGLAAFATCIGSLVPEQAIALGALRHDLPAEVLVATKSRLEALNGSTANNLIARTGSHIAYRADQAALALLDIDTKGMPPAVKRRIDALGGFWTALVSVLPELGTVGRVLRASTSAGIFRTDTGEHLPGSNGLHAYVMVTDGTDIERFLRALHARCWLHGFGWLMVGAGGQILDRSLVDRMVYAPERLVFEAAPLLDAPLVQDHASRTPVVTAGPPLDTRIACPNLTIVEQASLRDTLTTERRHLAPAAEKVRGEFIAQQAPLIVARTGCTLDAARDMVKRHCGGILLPAVVLPFDAAEYEGTTVGDVLGNPDRFIGATLADPLEGRDYGRCKAMIMYRSDGTLWINSLAHGRTVYELKHNLRSIEAAIRSVDPGETAERFVRLLLAAELEPDEEQYLRDLVCKLSGVKARPLGAKIRAARADQATQRAKAGRERQAAERTDTRVQLTAPLPDAELFPIARAVDDVLRATRLTEPPTRDLDLWPVEVRMREAFRLNGILIREANTASDGVSDGASEPAVRLPPPKMWLLTRHDKFSMEHLIERHIEFIQETEHGYRPVALHVKFVEHNLHYRESKLPIVGAIVTNPLVLADGALLAPDGLDRERRVVFKIEHALRDLLPKPEECTANAVTRAMHFLLDEWLCDVATDFAGKCVLIAAAMTILERTLLPDRPVFFITAGQRGGGKTTTLIMLFLAACGHSPPACAWSPNEEERRKALFSYLREGVAAVVWDNIPRGSTISCPAIERSTTSESYSDRVLRESRTETVPAFTISMFTGNNVAPRGDMASRALMARLAVNRPDPENREYKHPDPVAWTEAHRGNILCALYKMWWQLIGSAVEHGARLLLEEIESLVVDAPENAPPTRISFREMFNAFEAEEEQSTALATVLDVLMTRWSSGFKAADLVSFVGAADETAINFKAALEQATGKPVQIVTATVITWRLKALVDAPVHVGDRVLALKYVAERGHGETFCVRSLG